MAATVTRSIIVPPASDLKYRFLMPGRDAQVEKMLLEEGHTFTTNVAGGDYDIALFTGGADISPWLYGQRPHARTSMDMNRDLEEIRFFQSLPHIDLPKVGICRGGQLLNVLSGGSMWQHVDNHALAAKAGHWAETWEGDKISVTSTHHQMMRPRKDAVLLMWTDKATRKEDDRVKVTDKDKGYEDTDCEAAFYYHTNALCFQPHPEFAPKNSPTREVFWKFIRDYFGTELVHKWTRLEKKKALN